MPNCTALPRLRKTSIFTEKYEPTVIDTIANISMVKKVKYLKKYVKRETGKAMQHKLQNQTNYRKKKISKTLKNIYNTVTDFLLMKMMDASMMDYITYL